MISSTHNIKLHEPSLSKLNTEYEHVDNIILISVSTVELYLQELLTQSSRNNYSYDLALKSSLKRVIITVVNLELRNQDTYS